MRWVNVVDKTESGWKTARSKWKNTRRKNQEERRMDRGEVILQ